MKFRLTLGKTAQERQGKLKAAFGEDARTEYGLLGRCFKITSANFSRRLSRFRSSLHRYLFDCEEIVHQKLVPLGQVVNRHYCWETVTARGSKSDENALKIKEPGLLIHCDTEPTHTALSVQQLLTTRSRCTLFLQLAYYHTRFRSSLRSQLRISYSRHIRVITVKKCKVRHQARLLMR